MKILTEEQEQRCLDKIKQGILAAQAVGYWDLVEGLQKQLGHYEAVFGAMREITPDAILGAVERWQRQRKQFFDAPVGMGGAKPADWGDYFNDLLSHMQQEGK